MSSVIGVVDDSIRGGRLIGAMVTIVGSMRQAATDANGIFQIDSIAPGPHQLVVTHPLLDTLGIQILSAPFTLNPGVRTQIGAHTPSYEEIKSKACPRGGVATGSALLIGRVNLADSDDPAVGAAVSLVYKDLVTKDGVEKVRNARVSATGSFAICGLPATIAGTLQASLAGAKTADLPVKTNDAAISTAMLSIGGASTSGSAVLRGSITSKLGAPIGGAQVTLVGTTTIAVTADDGSFTLAGLPGGTHELVARKIGFARASEVLTISPRGQNTVKVILEEAQILSTIHIVSQMDDGLSKMGFLARKQLGRGWYLTPEQIEQKNPQITTDLFRTSNGIRMMQGRGGRILQSSSSAGSSQDGCMNIFIDHARFDQMQAGDVDDAIPVADLGAIEYYANPSSVPSEFNVVGKTCATLVVWTKTLLMTIAKPPKP